MDRNWGNTEIRRFVQPDFKWDLSPNTTIRVNVMQLKQSQAFTQLTVDSDNKFSDLLIV